MVSGGITWRRFQKEMGQQAVHAWPEKQLGSCIIRWLIPSQTSEAIRANVFFNSTKELYGVDFWEQYHLSSPDKSTAATTYGALVKGDLVLALWEVKAESGSGGDSYMQLMRDYDIAVNRLRSKYGGEGKASGRGNNGDNESVFVKEVKKVWE